MKTLVVAIIAIALSVAAVVGGAAVQSGTSLTGPDAVGFATVTAAAGALLIAALHWPVLARLRRRTNSLRPSRAALIAALWLNAPVYVALAVLGRNRALFAGGEVVWLGLGFALMGLLFGAGYAHTHRDAAA